MTEHVWEKGGRERRYLRAGRAPRRLPPLRPHLWRAVKITLGIGMVFVGLVGMFVILAGSSGGGRAWIRVGTIADVRSQGVVFVERANAFVVSDGRGFLALSGSDPHLGEQLYFCQSSGMFEDPYHGSKHSSFGSYRAGPAPRGMDRFAIRDNGGSIEIDPSQLMTGPPRGTDHPRDPDPTGPFCLISVGDRDRIIHSVSDDERI